MIKKLQSLINKVILRCCCSGSQPLNEDEALNKDFFRATHSVGFTLIELLVVVLIIGVLTAIALPQYQTAVDKSRYATLMPMAKSVANAQEAFYMNGGHYSDDLAYLDVQLPNDPSGTVANVGDGLKVEISEDSEYGYVKMSKEGLENNYIIYQDNSLNYPKEIHCEALKNSERAERLCKALGGEYISGSLSHGYDTYVLEGGGSGIPWSLAYMLAHAPAGWQQCDTYPCTKSCTREVKAGYTCTGTYNEDLTYNELVCLGDVCTSIDYSDADKKTKRNTCVMSGDVCNVKNYQTYDENGNILVQRICAANNADGSCSSYTTSGNQDYTYDDNGNPTSIRYCSAVTSDGDCSSYTGSYYTYDANGNVATGWICSQYNTDGSCTQYGYNNGWNYTYDANGNKTAGVMCRKHNDDGSCNGYSTRYDYTYDSNGKKTSEMSCGSKNITSDGNCSSYTSGYYNTYDSNGNQTSYKWCNGDNCSNYYSGQDYSYDTNGNKTSTRTCTGYNASGYCNKYSNGYYYTYDANGNMTSARSCSGSNINTSNGSCKSYNGGSYYAHDVNGQTTSYRYCSGSNLQSNGSCSSYSSGTDYTYDSNGNKTSERMCSGSGIQSDGSCGTYYKGKEYSYDEQGNQIATRTCSSWSGTTCNNWQAWSAVN